MSTLLDIAPQFDIVHVGGIDLRVFGLSAAAIASLLFRFPELAEIFKNGVSGLDQAVISKLGDEAIGAMIAHALRDGDNAEIEAVARSLGLGDQLAILKPCYDRTFPKGVEDFLTTLGLAAPGAEAEAARAAS